MLSIRESLEHVSDSVSRDSPRNLRQGNQTPLRERCRSVVIINNSRHVSAAFNWKYRLQYQTFNSFIIPRFIDEAGARYKDEHFVYFPSESLF